MWAGFTFIFWIVTAITDKETAECEQEDFFDNKLTCWPAYSLWYLGNPYYFSKFVRLTMFYVQNSFILFFVGCLGRLNIYNLLSLTILWYGVAAWMLSLIPMYGLGLMTHIKSLLYIELF